MACSQQQGPGGAFVPGPFLPGAAGLVEVLDEGAELADVAALVDGVAERLVAADHRVAAVPRGDGLGVQPRTRRRLAG